MEKVVPARPGVVAKTIEISWHAEIKGDDAEMKKVQSSKKKAFVPEAQPVYEVAFHPCSFAPDGTMNKVGQGSNRLRFASVGGEGCVKIWDMNLTAADTFLFNFGHKEMANVVSLAANEAFGVGVIPSCLRWSPHGLILAVGCGTGALVLFRQTPNGTPSEGCSEKWEMYRQLTALTEEVTDMCFSPDSSFLMATSRTGAVHIYAIDQIARSSSWQMDEVHQLCLAAAWDPWNRLIGTFGTSPALRVCTVTVRAKDRTRIDVSQEKKAASGLHVENDTEQTVRMSYSPDGMLLAVPFGKSKGTDAPRCVYIYTREAVDRPTVKLGMIEGKSSPIQGVAWAPGFFEPLSTSSSGGNGGGAEATADDTSATRLPWGPCADYRMALAVWNEDSVIVYTTDSSGRYAFFNNLHVAGITTVSWSPCARYLLVSSLDCYVSLIHFAVPIGEFHPNLSFVKAPSACALLQEVLSGMAEKGKALEERVACVRPMDDGDDAVNNAVVVSSRIRKKARKEETPAAAAAPPVEVDADALAAQLEL